MRIAIYSVIFFVVSAVIVSLYIIRDTNRMTTDFKKDQSVSEINKMSTTNTSDEKQQKPREEFDSFEQAEAIDKSNESISVPEPPSDNMQNTLFDQRASTDTIDNNSLYILPDTEEEEEIVEQQPPEKTVFDLSLEQIIENNRKSLIARHGDIPEVHIYLKHFPFEALLNSEGNQGFEVELSLKDNLDYLRAVAHLFPNKENNDNYLEALELYETLEPK